ncbi:MAG TPA: PepSY domain-containing protein [Novosphingobium sp.]|nr:PepSY domain-containing protein [Novosphingobium sp.]
MRRSTAFLCALLAASVPLSAEAAPRRDAQGEVRKDMREGHVRSLREIERQVLPSMPKMQYLGPEYDPTAMAYRLKFIHDGRVVFVDVDARSGQVLRQR